MEWHILLVGVVTGVSIHQLMEPMGILQKLSRLDTAIKTGKIVDPIMKGIDTRAKSYALGLIMLTIMSAIAYFITVAIDPGVEAAIQYSVVVALLAEIIAMARIDKYHVEIEKMTKDHKK